MRYRESPSSDKYVDVEYYQFRRGRLFNFLWKFSCLIIFPFVGPLAVGSKVFHFFFKPCSEFLSLFPSLIGFVARYVFYRIALQSCGQNVLIDFGTVFYYPKTCIGSNVTFGIGNIIQHCDFGDNVLVGDSCRFIGGTEKHIYESVKVPINRQGGRIKKIKVSSDSWVDTNSVIMESVGEGSVIRAGSVVIDRIEPYSICAGNPAAVVGKRR